VFPEAFWRLEQCTWWDLKRLASKTIFDRRHCTWRRWLWWLVESSMNTWFCKLYIAISQRHIWIRYK
jgi:hypothetical protein